jgi:hypothetical protein
MKYMVTVLDRDGGIIPGPEELYDTPEDADRAGEFYVDDPRYGSHEIEKVDNERI